MQHHARSWGVIVLGIIIGATLNHFLWHSAQWEFWLLLSGIFASWIVADPEDSR